MKNKLNILVTGANGQLGKAIRTASAGSADNYVFTDVQELDITDAMAVDKAVREANIDVIINCAAYTNVDAAESDPNTAELLNATAVAHLASAAKKADATLIHISTDYVFGGNPVNTPCTEELPLKPTGVYGITKLHGEQAVAREGAKAIIIRTAWLYSEHGRNFVKTMLALTASKPEIKVVFDQAGSPTYAQDLADAIVNIVTERKFEGREGIYHYSNEGVCSWYDLACLTAAMAGNKGCTIKPCHSDEFPSPVKRPPYSVLDKTKFKDSFGLEIPFWMDSLRRCIDNISNSVQ